MLESRNYDFERGLLRRFWSYLTSLRGRTLQIYFYLHLFNLYHLVRRDYRDKYEQAALDGREQQGRRQQATESRPRWFPAMSKVYVAYRYLSTIYMIYVAVKILIPKQIGFVLRLVGMSKPAHCYLIGRFRIHHQINSHVAIILASFNLVWRLVMFFFSHRRRIANNTIYFMLLSERELKDFYSSLASRKLVKESRQSKSERYGYSLPLPMMHRRRVPPGALSVGHGEELKSESVSRAQLMRDVMCYRVEQLDARTTFTLRPNRTKAASRQLSQYFAHVTIWTTAIFSTIAACVTVALLVTTITNERYLRDYPNCDPLLEQLRREHKLAEWWRLSPFRHQTIAMLFDIIENALLWIESGLISAFFVGYAFAFNYDNLVYWDHLRRKIANQLELTRNQRRKWQTDLSDQFLHHDFDQLSSTRIKRADWSRPIHKLQMELRDFVSQLSQSDKIMTDLVSMALSVWFVLFAAFIYDLVATKRKSFPLELCLALLFVLSVVSSMWLVLLTVHRRCHNSYTSLCSLMALDQSERKRQFIPTLEYFSKQKTCYTFYRTRPITATSYVTIIGYSFSIFFVLASTSNRGR